VKRYFCFDGNDYRFFATADEAQAEAQRALEFYRSDAWSSGEWDEGVASICWGKVIEAVEESLLVAGEHEVAEYHLSPVGATPEKHTPSVYVETWEIEDAALVARLRAATTREAYEKVVIAAISSPFWGDRRRRMIPPSGISPWKEWAQQKPYRRPVRWLEGSLLWEAAPINDQTLALLCWGSFAV
jgi:hypothetical protein